MKKTKRLSLQQYVKRRNGVAMGSPGSLSNMLYRSFGAGTFAGFWRHWNPIFGYYLGRDIFVPLKRWAPAPIALIATFIACGALHDLVTMAVRQDVALFFVPSFAGFGISVVLTNALNIDCSALNWWLRAAINLGLIAVCFLLAMAFRI